jgi:hypothetical protein
MKKSLLFIGAAFSLFTANSQIIYSEDFDGIPGPTAGGAGTYTFAPGWSLRNVDNATPAANVSYVNEAWERREDFNFNVADSTAFSTSWYAPAGTSNDWMWTPLIGPIPANTVLKWNAVTYDAAYRDGYEVRIMVAPTTPTGGTGVIGNQITNSTVVFSTAAENTTWTPREVSLAAYAGQSIYIAFRNNSTDKFLLLIDDVVVQQITNYDLSVSNVSHGEYTVSPLEHQTTTANFELKGTLTNLGLMAMTNATLACDVIVDGTLLTTVQSAVYPSIASGATEQATIAYTPTVEGSYSFKFYPMATETDQMTDNDTVFDATGLVIEPTMMRRDFGPVAGSLGIGAGELSYIGQTFRFETAVNIEAIESFVTRGYTGRELRAAIFNTDGSGVPTTLLASTDTLLYPDDSARLYTMPIYGGTINLPAGEYAFVQVEIDSTLALANTNALFTPNTVYVQWPSNGPNFVPVESFGPSFSKPMVIYPKFDMCVGETEGTVVNTTQASCGMNDGSAEIDFGPEYTLLWEDSTTTSIHSALGAGWHTFTVTSEYCTFTDSVEITNPNAPTAVADDITHAPCFGADGTIELNIQDGTDPYTVTWSDGSTGETLTGPAGVYSATIVDANNCSTVVTGAEIIEPAELTASVSGTDETCAACDDGTATATVSGGTAPYSVVWSNGSTGLTITDLEPGTYSAAITDSNGCSVTTGDVVISEFIGIEELSDYGIVVYPNPVSDYLSITAKKNNVTAISLIDASGKLISMLTKTNETFTADMRGLAKGTYQLIIRTTSGTIVTAVAKQ